MRAFFYYTDIQPTNFANVEAMLFEVFRCEETDTINNIAIAQFLKVSTLFLGIIVSN